MQKWDLIKNGILTSYQAIRDQAHIIGLTESNGCCYSQGWDDVQFQRMPNVSLQPGKEKLSVDDMIKNVEKGIYIIGDGSFLSISNVTISSSVDRYSTKLRMVKLQVC